MISPSNRSASASASALLPVAVGPNTATALALFNVAHCHAAHWKATAEHAEIFVFFSVTLHSSSLSRCGPESNRRARRHLRFPLCHAAFLFTVTLRTGKQPRSAQRAQRFVFLGLSRWI